MSSVMARAEVAASRARLHFGNEAQDRMVVEECGELLTALARRDRGRGSQAEVDEEVADVLLVVLGMVNGRVLDVLNTKIERLNARMEAFCATKAPAKSSVAADMASSVTLTEALRRRGLYSRPRVDGAIGDRVVCWFSTGDPVKISEETGEPVSFSPEDAWEWLLEQDRKGMFA